MATVIADNIISPLGATTDQVYRAIRAGQSALRRYQPTDELPMAYTASLFDADMRQSLMLDGYTRFESLAISSIRAALASGRVRVDDRTILIVSTTKGNVEQLQPGDNPEHIVSIGAAVDRIARAVGVSACPVAVCNACISGVSALILGDRLVRSGVCDTAIVCGVDVQSPFIISGFQSLKALSPDPCRPFDIERLGLNLGEAAATMILGRADDDATDAWRIHRGAVRNDAYHITNPSPVGEGCHQAIEYVIEGVAPGSIAQVNAHGTATMYNDQMESKAISRSGLSDTPLNGLKGYIGHTMGAAGVIETVLTMHALDDGTVLGTRGFDEVGVSGRVNIAADNRPASGCDFLKIISGFGGCNAAIHLGRTPVALPEPTAPTYTVTHRVQITPDSAMIDGVAIDVPQTGLKLLTWLYKDRINDYTKFYKMDPLARLGFVATELLLQAEGADRSRDNGDRAIVFCNSWASANADREYLATITDPDNYYPSPSLFVYTLPNIVAGEIAIRNHCHAETGFYVLPRRDQGMMDNIIKSTFADTAIRSVIAGWLEYKDAENYECDIFLAIKN